MILRTAIVLLLAVVGGLTLLTTGCARDPDRCCDEFSPNDDKGIYCYAHRDVVTQFVRDGRTAAEQRKRLDWFKGVLKQLEPLKDSDQVHDRLAQFEESRPEFWVLYEKHHFWAGRDTNLGLVRRGELMKCGFRHGVHEMELELAR